MIKPKAFTLVETLVAIAILMVAIVGPFMEIQNALVASYVARDTLIGNSLAQEGIEYVRSIRDGNYLYDRANPLATPQFFFVDGLDGSPTGTGSNGAGGTMLNSNNCISGTCTVDPWAASVATCPAGICPSLYTSPAPANLYTQSSVGGNIKTRFTRSIQLCYMNYSGSTSSCNSTPSNEVMVTVIVTWTTEGRAQSSTVVDYIQNWP